MITNRRQSPFRYVFKEPVEFELHLLSINGNAAPAKPVQARILNISRAGCCIAMGLSLPIEEHTICVRMEMVLHEEPITLQGELRWSLPDGDEFRYGIQLEMLPDGQERLSREMRELAGHKRIIAV